MVDRNAFRYNQVNDFSDLHYAKEGAYCLKWDKLTGEEILIIKVLPCYCVDDLVYFTLAQVRSTKRRGEWAADRGGGGWQVTSSNWSEGRTIYPSKEELIQRVVSSTLTHVRQYVRERRELQHHVSTAIPGLKLFEVMSKGSFGTVFRGLLKTRSGSYYCAVKLESQYRQPNGLLRKEFAAYDALGLVTLVSNEKPGRFRSIHVPEWYQRHEQFEASSIPTTHPDYHMANTGRDGGGGEQCYSLMQHYPTQKGLFGFAFRNRQREGKHHHHPQQHTPPALATGFPVVYDFAKTPTFDILVMSLHGPSLKQVIQSWGPFSTHTVLMVTYQVLSHLQYMHSQGMVHCDVKPANIVVGRKEVVKGDSMNNCCVYLLDLGLSKEYLQVSGVRLPPAEIHKAVSGTWNYMSVGCLAGKRPAPRDDVQSLCYTICWLLQGKLPWSQIEDSPEIKRLPTNQRNKMASEKILAMKRSTSPEDLAAKFPPPMVGFFKHCMGLRFDQDPNYSYLKKCILKAVASLGLWLDFTRFDWFSSDYIKQT